MATKNGTIKISPSGISYLMECPRCLWLQVNENVRRPRGIFPSLPNGMDNVFKKYFDEYRTRGELPPEIDGKVEGVLYNDDLKRFNQWREINFGKGGMRTQFPEIEVELYGAIDELLVSPDGKFVPFDFKTRGYPTKEDTHEHYRTQIDLYALLFKQNNMEPADYGYLLFFWPEAYHLGTANFKTDLVKIDVSPSRGYSVLKHVREIVSGPQPQAHQECEYCIYRGA
ncbi:MAG: hypothetical protein A3C07_02645 [Candidatus Sungbacteria bacterium RIFCSPHIGHO2_02_FULL_47_11]|uniref:PD-(D/E)XK endonuclease-like domain-containing protein n=1 Tax=Candidatus Sungbacteria bacterium RIFCSPHIGHO2_02_FULL_47_11 TaxID=1802270 RepID=A0A1G2KGA6_9BACT|nr:MAG: hypothetical protein A3C07_02645 [Candidatus Sungbacteria bacterium RIFCSPHIGHO2_02_FULL_47_11]